MLNNGKEKDQFGFTFDALFPASDAEIKCVRTAQRVIYSTTRRVFFNVGLVLITPLSLWWGIIFGLIELMMVWIMMPAMKFMSLWMKVVMGMIVDVFAVLCKDCKLPKNLGGLISKKVGSGLELVADASNRKPTTGEDAGAADADDAPLVISTTTDA